MTGVIIISILTVGLLLLAVIFIPEIKVKNIKIETFWIAALMGAFMMIVFGKIHLEEMIREITNHSSMNPLKILIIFISMTLLSIVLDELGFFKFLAYFALLKAKGKQMKMFLYLYITVSILTIFTSNDIIVLTFTPFICYFCKHAKINPIPYLISEFVAANSWSMMLIIGNPTNIYLASSYEVGFIEYFKVMFLPTVVSASFSFVLLYFIFKKSLAKEITTDHVMDLPHELKNKKFIIIALIHLSLCTILLTISSYIGFEMYFICFAFAISLTLIFLIYAIWKKEAKDVLLQSYKKLPWTLIPFVLSMFILVLTLNKFDITIRLATFLNRFDSVFGYGIGSFLSANIINNIPMSVLFSNMISHASNITSAIYAAIIGSNLGAFLTPIGALAGIMWLKMLKQEEVSLSFLGFIRYGVLLSIPVLLVALGVLYIVL